MLPVNLLNALKEYTLAQQRTPLPAAAADAPQKNVPQLDVGQKVQGVVQTQVAANLFKVNVAGQLIQMQLPPTVRSGDTVPLQVVSLQPRLTFSMVNSATPLSTPEQLGATARLLSSMSQQAPEKAYVRPAQSTPLWGMPNPPESKQLAGQLREALSNSGLFYESHQAQWVEGARSTTQLMREPQNLAPELAKTVARSPAAPATPATPTTPTAPTAPTTKGSAEASTATGNAAVHATLPENAAGKPMVLAEDNAAPAVQAAVNSDATSSAQPSASSAQPDSKAVSIPEHLQPLVQQQLNALETRQMIWQGNIWPGQEMQWEIHEQAPQTPDMQTQRQWVTQIQLDLPNLGAVSATLRFNSAGLSLALNAETPQTRAVLGNASSRLVSALSDAGIPVLSTQVSNGLQGKQP